MGFKKQIKDEYYQEVNIDLDDLKKDISFREQNTKKTIKKPILGLSLGIVMSVLVLLFIGVGGVFLFYNNSKSMSYDASHLVQEEDFYSDNYNKEDSAKQSSKDNPQVSDRGSYAGEPENASENSGGSQAPEGYSDPSSQDQYIDEENAESNSSYIINQFSSSNNKVETFVIGQSSDDLVSLFNQYSADPISNYDLYLIEDHYVIVVNGDVLEVKLDKTIDIKVKISDMVSFIYVDDEIVYESINISK